MFTNDPRAIVQLDNQLRRGPVHVVAGLDFRRDNVRGVDQLAVDFDHLVFRSENGLSIARSLIERLAS